MLPRLRAQTGPLFVAGGWSAGLASGSRRWAAFCDHVAVAGAVIVGFDGHESSGRVLERGITEAKARAGSLIIVVVEEAPFEPNLAGGYTLAPPQPVAAVSREYDEPSWVKELADHAVEHATQEGVASDVVWDVGDPVRTIADAARDRHAAAIVIGSHRHNLVQRLIGEDLAAAVRRRVECEVITVD